jgi:hypothetical protein
MRKTEVCGLALNESSLSSHFSVDSTLRRDPSDPCVVQLSGRDCQAIRKQRRCALPALGSASTGDRTPNDCAPSHR